MSTLQAPDERPAGPADRDAVRRPTSADGRRARRLPEWLKRPIPAAGGMYFTEDLVGELGLETICESAQVPEPLGVLDAADGDVHGPGRDLHPPLRLLRREAGPARGRRRRRARPPGRGLRPARPAARRDHVGHPRRPARRRRRALPPLRPGRPRADRRDDRGPDARLRRPTRRRSTSSCRPRPRSSTTTWRPSPGSSSTSAARASTPSAWRCSSTPSGRAPTSGPRAA